MSKQKIITVAGIALSFAIATGGWALTSTMINRKSDALLSVSGTTWINAPDARPVAIPGQSVIEDNPSDTLSMLTEREMLSVLANWNSPGRERPHEPTAEQINMEEAIAIGEAALAYFNFIPANQLVFDRTKTTAFLCQNIPSGRNGQFLDPIYSYWAVTFTIDGVSRWGASMMINAVTGQVWKIDIMLLPDVSIEFDAADIEGTLIHFIEDIGISGNEKISIITDSSSSITAFVGFADGGAYAVAETQYNPLPIEQNGRTLLQAHIYLTTKNPQK